MLRERVQASRDLDAAFSATISHAPCGAHQACECCAESKGGAYLDTYLRTQMGRLSTHSLTYLITCTLTYFMYILTQLPTQLPNYTHVQVEGR